MEVEFFPKDFGYATAWNEAVPRAIAERGSTCTVISCFSFYIKACVFSVASESYVTKLKEKKMSGNVCLKKCGCHHP